MNILKQLALTVLASTCLASFAKNPQAAILTKHEILHELAFDPDFEARTKALFDTISEDQHLSFLFLLAARDGRIDILKSLLAQDITLKTQVINELLFTGTVVSKALCEAAGKGNKEVVRFLLENGADVNTQSDGGTPLSIAAYFYHADIMQLLLDHGADSNVPGKNGWTALAYATARGETEMVQLLLDHGADINAKIQDKEWRGVPYLGVEGRTKTAQFFHSDYDGIFNFNTKIKDNGWTALMYAAAEGKTKTVQLLLDHGADINAESDHGRTALMTAVDNGQIEVVKMLLDLGANSSIRDSKGLRAYDYAKERSKHHEEEMLNLFHNYGIYENYKLRNIRFPLRS